MMQRRSEDFDEELVSARARELALRADGGVVAVGEFYSPREMHCAASVLAAAGYRGRFTFIGGYEGAERRRLCCLPDYAFYGVDTGDEAQLRRAAEEYAGDATSVIRIQCSGYKKLSHRDYMGAILALGIKRAVVGDIVADDGGAYVFCDAKIAEFISGELTRVGSDAVKTAVTELPESFTASKRTITESVTVASMRADGIVSAIANVSRERAKEMIASGLCEVNYEPLIKPDRDLELGDVLSVRGKGKFIISDGSGMTRRGRLRVIIEKYI